MQQLHITDPDGDSTGIPFWAGIPTEYQPRMEFLTDTDESDSSSEDDESDSSSEDLHTPELGYVFNDGNGQSTHVSPQ